jgi:hypothetical protein
VVTPLALLHPELALGALFIRSTFKELVESPIFRRIPIQFSVFLSIDTFVPLYPAKNAVRLIAHLAIELLVLLVAVPFEDKSAIWGWAVVEHVSVVFNEQFKLKF